MVFIPVTPIRASDEASINQSVNEMTSLFQRPEVESYGVTKKIASFALLAIFGGTVAAICLNRHKGVVVVPLVGALSLQLWVLARLNTKLSQRELVRIIATLQVYSLFAVALQYFADRPSRVSAFVMLIPYLVYWFAVSGFFDRATTRTIERINNPHFISDISQERADPPWYSFQPTHKIAYNFLNGTKFVAGGLASLNGLHVDFPYNLLLIVGGNLLVGDALGELVPSVYTHLTDESLSRRQTAIDDEGGYHYSCAQKTHLAVREFFANFSLFVGSTASGYALHYNCLPALLPAGLFVGFHQFFTKKELAQERDWNPQGVPELQFISKAVGYGSASLLGAAICAYAVVETLSNKNWLTMGSAINAVASVSAGFFVSRAVSYCWNRESGVFLTTLREHLIDNPVFPSFIVIVVNHAADQPFTGKMAKIGATVLGELGLTAAGYLLGSEGARILDKRLIYGIVKMSPAAVVVLSHMLVPLTKAITDLR